MLATDIGHEMPKRAERLALVETGTPPLHVCWIWARDWTSTLGAMDR